MRFIKYFAGCALLLAALVGCTLQVKHSILPETSSPTVADDSNSFEINLEGPANASPGEVIIVDASANQLDSIAWSAFIVYNGNVSRLNVIPIENSTKVIVPPKSGKVFLTCAGSRNKITKIKTMEILVSDGYNPGPGPRPDPDPIPVPVEAELTKFIKAELTKVVSSNLKAEKAILANNIGLALSTPNYATADEFTNKLRELNKATITLDMQSKWQTFNANLMKKLESMNLETVEQHLKAYGEILKGLQ